MRQVCHSHFIDTWIEVDSADVEKGGKGGDLLLCHQIDISRF